MKRLVLRKRVSAPIINLSVRLMLVALVGCFVLACGGETAPAPDQSPAAVTPPPTPAPVPVPVPAPVAAPVEEVVVPPVEDPSLDDIKDLDDLANVADVEEDEEADPTVEPETADQKKYKYSKKQSPLMALASASLKKVELNDKQPAKLKKIRKKNRKGVKDLHKAMTDFHVTLLASVETGETKVGALKPQFKALRKGKETKLNADKEMLNALHGLLKPKQRKTLADAAREKISKLYEDAAEDKAECGCGKSKEDCECKKEKAEDKAECGCGKSKEDCECKKKKSERCPIVNIRKLTKGMDLTGEQKTQVADLIKKMKKKLSSKDDTKPTKDETKALLIAVFDAFEKDTFDAGTLEIPGHPDDVEVDKMRAHVKDLAALVKILNEDQRKKLAKKLDKHFVKMHSKRSKKDKSKALDEAVSEAVDKAVGEAVDKAMNEAADKADKDEEKVEDETKDKADKKGKAGKKDKKKKKNKKKKKKDK